MLFGQRRTSYKIAVNVIDKGLMYIHNRREWLTKVSSQIIVAAVEVKLDCPPEANSSMQGARKLNVSD